MWLVEGSAAAREDLDCELNVRFGPTLDETIDIFPASQPGTRQSRAVIAWLDEHVASYHGNPGRIFVAGGLVLYHRRVSIKAWNRTPIRVMGERTVVPPASP